MGALEIVVTADFRHEQYRRVRTAPPQAMALRSGAFSFLGQVISGTPALLKHSRVPGLSALIRLQRIISVADQHASTKEQVHETIHDGDAGIVSGRLAFRG